MLWETALHSCFALKVLFSLLSHLPSFLYVVMMFTLLAGHCFNQRNGVSWWVLSHSLACGMCLGDSKEFGAGSSESLGSVHHVTSLCPLPLGTVWLCDVSTHQSAGNTVTLDFVHCEPWPFEKSGIKENNFCSLAAVPRGVGAPTLANEKGLLVVHCCIRCPPLSLLFFLRLSPVAWNTAVNQRGSAEETVAMW